MASTMSGALEIVARTDPGLVREHNEDAVFANPVRGLAILADGMGGYNAGEVAAAMAISFVTTELGRWLAEGGAQASGRELRRAMDRDELVLTSWPAIQLHRRPASTFPRDLALAVKAADLFMDHDEWGMSWIGAARAKKAAAEAPA